MSIFSNSAVFCFTAPTFDQFDEAKSNKFVPFLILVFLLLGFRQLVKVVIPDIPGHYVKVMARHDQIVDKYIKNWVPRKQIVDEDESALNTRIYCTDKITKHKMNWKKKDTKYTSKPSISS